MTKATDLSAALEQRLQTIDTSTGYATNLQAVYGFGERVRDGAATPYLLVRLARDEVEQRAGRAVARIAQYEIEGVFARTASLQDLQRCQHDILRALGAGEILPDRPLKPGEPIEEAVEYDPEQNGSPHRRFISTLSIRYVEQY